MKIGIIGHLGNMGRRYVAICDKLRLNWIGYDVKYGHASISDFIELNKLSHLIIASPTDYHMDHIRIATTWPKLKILCEKPFFKDDYKKNLEILKKIHSKNLYMVNQYAYHLNLEHFSVHDSNTTYDYYHSGGDGLAWDCIQLIALSHDSTRICLKNNSPIWIATINGISLSKNLMDYCYVDMIEDFVFETHGKLWGIEKIIEAHEAVIGYEKQSLNRDTVAKHQ